MITRGDVVIVFIPFTEPGGRGKQRPAVVVQRQEINLGLPHTVVAAITSQLALASQPYAHLLDPADSEGKASGVIKKSLIRCDRLFTVDQNSIDRKIGRLAFGTIDRVEDCLRASLGLPPQAQPTLGNYEKWPGYLELRERLQMFSAVLDLNVSGQAFLSVDIQRTRLEPIEQLWAKEFQLIVPASKQEFQDTGHSIRVTFRINDESRLAKARQFAPNDLEKYPIHRATLWAYSGSDNRIMSAYTGECLNEGSQEVYLMSISDGLFEIGFNADGNLFDSLLLSDRLHLESSEVQKEEG
jgi:mRNA-degrading endonuclease toxin of MazEF toxin-antitoxin module